MADVPSTENSNRARGTALTLLGVTAALALVAVAARGETPIGSPGRRRPTELLLDTLLSLFVILMLFGLALFLYLILLRKEALLQASGGTRKRRSPVRSVLVYGIFLLAITLAIRALQSAGTPAIKIPSLAPGGTGTLTGPETGKAPYEPQFAWIPVVIVALLVGGGGLAAWLSARARRRSRGGRETTFAEELADVLAETLDDLRAESDPRRAVIGAYARLERALAASGLPRRPAEAPLEYLARILTELRVTPTAARRLTLLFERAKFSQHEIGTEMKDEAIAALETVQDELRAAELQAEAERLAALEALRERAAG